MIQRGYINLQIFKPWSQNSRSVFFYTEKYLRARGTWFKDRWLMSPLLYPLQLIPGPLICGRAQAHDVGLTHTSRVVLLLLDQVLGPRSVFYIFASFFFSFNNIRELKCNRWNYNNQTTSWAHFLEEAQSKSDSNGLAHSLQQYGILQHTWDQQYVWPSCTMQE